MWNEHDTSYRNHVSFEKRVFEVWFGERTTPTRNAAVISYGLTKTGNESENKKTKSLNSSPKFYQ